MSSFLTFLGPSTNNLTLASSISKLGLSFFSATLYLALYPLFTTSEVSYDRVVNDPSLALFHVIARSVSTVIDNFVHLHESNRIISIWMATK